MDSYLIEYAGKISGKSFDFHPIENEMAHSEKAAAIQVYNNLDGEVFREYRATKINVSDGTAYDVTEDVAQWLSEMEAVA
jgi:hypothetical protein